jgi:hypothetical protein
MIQNNIKINSLPLKEVVVGVIREENKEIRISNISVEK